MLQIQSFIFSPIQENTYILYNEFKQCIVIDPGCYFDEEKETLQTFIQQKGLKPVMLLNTHCHLDHVFGNKFVAETYSLKLQLHEKEKAVLSFAPTSGLMYNMPFDNYTGELIELKEGDKVLLGGDELEIIEAPGHSPGSICFYCRKQHFVIGGDVLFQRSIGRTDLPGGSHQTLLNSIRKKLFTLPDETIVYSGHGSPTTIGEEKKQNPYLS
ncbi:MBL fold metallo-hydrolase [Ferruginibacter paludis]|jgi:hydroxyacylglutathione hydrolase|uniref:MBL fold metallo-hydrolase n=1 Tax=Ferruginibacter TaxID=1004303 RepID=UPI0025B39A78|nr:MULTISPECIES: MBL fold metallo-hydrolase [Ferruginibacter]MDB5276026.1 fold metallo-hydrolase [Ferruginibacter sp.]MDN3658960.1 MBL fold metallo-hydrolase [Ferruginibacter paludis]